MKNIFLVGAVLILTPNAFAIHDKEETEIMPSEKSGCTKSKNMKDQAQVLGRFEDTYSNFKKGVFNNCPFEKVVVELVDCPAQGSLNGKPRPEKDTMIRLQAFSAGGVSETMVNIGLTPDAKDGLIMNHSESEFNYSDRQKPKRKIKIHLREKGQVLEFIVDGKSYTCKT